MACIHGGLAGACSQPFEPPSSSRSIPRRHSALPLLRLRRNWSCPTCISKPDEQQSPSSPNKFAIPVPKFRDTDSARRLLESAFQALSFDIPRLPIESALQGLSSGVSRFSIPKQIFLFDITGFIATKLRKPPGPKEQEEMDAMLEEEVQYPRCAWPRTSQGAESQRISAVTKVRQQDASKVNLAEFSPSQSLEPSARVYPHSKWPRETIQKERAESVVGQMYRASEAYSPSSKATVGPHCAWPRGSRVASNSSPTNGNSVPTEPIFKGSPGFPTALNASPSNFLEGVRCAWPRVPIPSSQSSCRQNAAELTDSAKPEVDLTEATKEEIELVGRSPAVNDAGVPRRTLATSVVFTLMNQLAQGSLIETSPIDLLGLLPAASFVVTEDGEAVTPELDRRTLLLFFVN